MVNNTLDIVFWQIISINDIYQVKDKKLDFKKFFVCFFSVGKPIPVIKTENLTENWIEEVHFTYVHALKELYDEYNPIYRDPKIQLNNKTSKFF